jgi:hypothetical protein
MAHFGGDVETITGLESGNDFTNDKYTIVNLSAANTVVRATNATSRALFGVVINDPSSAQAATVAVRGVVKIRAAGSVTAAVLITTDSSGRATAAVSGDLVIGRALEAAGAAGENITCYLHGAILPLAHAI